MKKFIFLFLIGLNNIKSSEKDSKMYKNLQAIVLAAGKSSRFNTKQSKLIEKICGQEMILYTTKILESMNIPTTLIVGYQKEVIENLIAKKHGDKINFVHQKEQLGTGHAVKCSESVWEKEDILILNGDCPLINKQILNSLIDIHLKNNATISFVTAHNIDPTPHAYGRVVEENGKIKIVEAKDDKEDRYAHCCINAGIYLVKREFLKNTIFNIEKSKVTGEFYIIDLINIASEKGLKVETINAPFDIIRGINTLQELWAAEQIKRAELIKYWMEKGIRFSAAQNNHIDLNVEIGSGTYIGASVQLYGSTKIGQNCKIEAFSVLENATLQDNVHVQSHTVIKNSEIKSNANVGPFAHIHSDSTIHEESKIGNFVDLKNSQIGSCTKIKHLSYIGDAQIGNKVNIGAGTIICNYNGINKEKTVIHDKAFIGSHNSIIAPITIGQDTFTAAGSVITKDVPDNAFAIARSHQINKEDYAKKIKKSAIVNKNKTSDSAV